MCATDWVRDRLGARPTGCATDWVRDRLGARPAGSAALRCIPCWQEITGGSRQMRLEGRFGVEWWARQGLNL
jgi:hypothetical protein